MRYYKNGLEITKKEMQVQGYIEQYRFTLAKIFIIKYIKGMNYKSGLKFMLSFFLWLLILIIGTLSLNSTEAYEGNLLGQMNLPDCRITQYQDSHIQKSSGSMYAYDIACMRGRTFEVFAPNYKDIYVVKYVGYDKRIGNYVTIKHGNLYFIYGHTLTDLKVGTGLKPGQLIGRTDISGISQNYHLHLELWEDTENISFNYLEGKGSIKAEKSKEIREQRNWISGKEVNTQILEFIAGFEGVSLTSYYDFKHFSIGYGTPSYNGEVITLKEAKTRARIRIQKIKDRYNLHNHPIKIQIAVTSFVYNIGSLTSDQKWLLNNYYYSALGNNFKLYNGTYKNGVIIILAGLQKRRKAEDNLLRGI